MIDPRKYTFDEIDAALSVWDALLTRNTAEPDPKYQTMMEFWENYGTAHMREVAVDLGLWADAIWSELPEPIRDNTVFDWEFVPLMLEHVRWSPHEYRYPPVKDMIDMMIAKHALLEG